MDVEIDISTLTLGDIEDLQDNEVPMKRKREILDACTGGKARAVRLVDLPKLITAIGDALKEEANPTQATTKVAG